MYQFAARLYNRLNFIASNYRAIRSWGLMSRLGAAVEGAHAAFKGTEVPPKS